MCRLRYYFLFFICLSVFGCQEPYSINRRHKVYIAYQHGKYILYRNDRPFIVKGGSGYTNLKYLSQIGGNTIRTWDTTGLQQVLDSAQVYHLAVIAGLPMPTNTDMDAFYDHDEKVKTHFKRLNATVNHYKNHPALLAWCLGNELPFPYKPTYNRFYEAFNQVIDMIHRDDPDHPVTTTIMTFQKKNIANIRLRTNIDFISFNIFGSIKTLSKDLQDFKWMWNGPFLITEWGIEGPWLAEEQNAWGAYVENTSAKKAEQYRTIYQKYMPVSNPRFLGSLVFYWGQKQELTPTWFSLFDENGRPTAAVDVLSELWTGQHIKTNAPAIKYMLIDNKGGRDNLLYHPAALASAKVWVNDRDTTHFTYKWELLPEDWYKENDQLSLVKPAPIPSILTHRSQSAVQFVTPKQEGPYRLFVYIYNTNGYYATANIPFYVLNNP